MKIYKMCGIIAALIPIVTIIALSFLAKDFTLFSNYISDLGVSEYAIIFNTSLIIAGILLLPLVLHIYEKDKYLAVLFLTTGAALAGVGIFNEASELHTSVSAAFFLLSFITMLYAGIREKSDFGKVSIVLSLLGFLGLAFFNPFIETLLVFAIAGWIVAFAMKMK